MVSRIYDVPHRLIPFGGIASGLSVPSLHTLLFQNRNSRPAVVSLKGGYDFSTMSTRTNGGYAATPRRGIIRIERRKEVIMGDKDAKLVMILKYCLIQKAVTWHILCVAGVLQCLECFLKDRIDERLSRYAERMNVNETAPRNI